MLEVNGLSVVCNGCSILKDINFHIDHNQWTMIVGPNGAGKSTVINAISQRTPYQGTITFEGRNIAGLKTADLAKKVGVLAQKHQVTYSFTVKEIVSQGRYAYSSAFFPTGCDKNDEKVQEAMELTGISHMKNQSVLTLSGGELQRTFLAQLLAQDPRLLILDEPTNHLDLVYQKQIFGIIENWVRQTGRSVISVVHDLSLARAYGTHAILLNHGEIMAFDEVSKALSKNNMERAYLMDVYEWMHRMLVQWEENIC